MSATIYSTPVFTDTAPKVATKSTTASKGFFARLYDAIVESRMEQAQRELARYETLYARDKVR